MGALSNAVVDTIREVIAEATTIDTPDGYRDAGMMLRGIRRVLHHGNVNPQILTVLTADINRLENLATDPAEHERFRAARDQATTEALSQEEPIGYPRPV